MMKSMFLALAVATSTGSAFAASVVNRDADPVSLVVTEGGTKTELSVAGGETVQFCASGCFVTMPNGDREALTGAETLEISGGKAQIK
jgi:hypothetical protein